MRGHRHLAPHAGSSFADLPDETRGYRAVVVIFPRDIHVRRADGFPVELMAGQALASFDQSPARRWRGGTRSKRGPSSARRDPILQVLRGYAHPSGRDRPVPQGSVLTISHANRVTHRNSREVERPVAADKIDINGGRLVAGH